MGVIVERLGEGEWAAYAGIRLAALADTPSAFASTLAREEGFDEATWRSRLRGGVTLAARAAGDPQGALLGTVTGLIDAGDPTAMHLVAMYVVPAARGTGCAGRLVDALVATARQQGLARVITEVADANPRARRFYTAAGFAPTGRARPMPRDPSVREVELSLVLT